MHGTMMMMKRNVQTKRNVKMHAIPTTVKIFQTNINTSFLIVDTVHEINQ